MRRKITLLSTLLLIFLSIIKIGEAAELPIKAFVSILPQSYFVERIGSTMVSVEVLVEPGKDPHTFDPTPKQMMALSYAQLYFGIGFPFEQRIIKKMQLTNPRLKLIHTDRGIKKRPLDVPHIHENDAEGHRHEHEADQYEERNHQDKGKLDPHIWLAAPEINIQVKNIYHALTEIDPAHRVIYKKNLDQFLKELEEVHAALQRRFEPLSGRLFFVFHPSFGYFADAYGLRQIPVEIEGKSPTPRQIEAIIKEAKSQDVRIIFVAPQFSRKSAEIIARAIGGVVVPINPLEKNVLENLEDIAKKIQHSLE